MADRLAEWTAALAHVLDVDPSALDRDLILAVARDAAHQVARPAAPLTTFLVGYAAGLRGGGLEAVRSAGATAQQLAAQQPAADDQTDLPRGSGGGE